MNSSQRLILAHAKVLNELQSKVRETSRLRGESAASWEAWKKATAEFHERYDELAFPGGLADAFERLESGDKQTVEAALDFIECRPYFFRSGYLYKDLMRKLRTAPMATPQRERYESLREKYRAYRRSMIERRPSHLVNNEQAARSWTGPLADSD